MIHVRRLKKAVDEYRLATELDPSFMDAWYGLAKAYHGYFDYGNAAKTYTRPSWTRTSARRRPKVHC